jgi:hypothetical protein
VNSDATFDQIWEYNSCNDLSYIQLSAYITFTTQDLDILVYTHGMLVYEVNSNVPLICPTLVKILTLDVDGNYDDGCWHVL